MQISWATTRLGAAGQMDIAKSLMLVSDEFTVGSIGIAGAPTYEPDTELYRASMEFSLHYEKL